MIAEFLNRDVVLDQLAALTGFVTANRDTKRAAGQSAADDEALLAELTKADEEERNATSGQSSFEPPAPDRRGLAAPPPLDDYSFFSREPVISLLQSALDEAAHRTNSVKTQAAPDDRRGAAPPLITHQSLGKGLSAARPKDRRLFDKFSVLDAGWVRSKVAEGIRLFRGKHDFNAQPARPVTLLDRARLVIVGDWGTGLPRAQAVAKQMQAKIDEALAGGIAVHAIHLGDVYYSGWDEEYQKRFLPYWPVRPADAERVGSWSLNGNHDMYSGGHAYFDLALADPRFARWQSDGHASTSFFSLVNNHWKILGLDTAWDDAGLKDPQDKWLKEEIGSAGGRKTLLLSHHQLFSVYDKAAPAMSERVSPILRDHPVTAWFWGHEHRCMLFADHENVKFGRCVGDGGVPVYQWHHGNEYPPPGTYEHRRFIEKGLEHWAYMGFAVLDFAGETIDVKYIDENGYEHHKETIS